VDVLVEQYQRMRLDKNSGNNARKSWYLDPVFPLNFWLEKKLEWMDNSIPKGSYEDLNCSDELYKDVPSHHMIFTKVPRYHHFIIAQCKALWVATRNSFSTEDESAVPGAGATLPNKRLPAGRTPLQLGASLASVLQLPAITPPPQPDSSALSSHTSFQGLVLVRIGICWCALFGLMRNASGFYVQLYTRAERKPSLSWALGGPARPGPGTYRSCFVPFFLTSASSLLRLNIGLSGPVLKLNGDFCSRF
jgi:hypothetical protein